MMLSLDDEINEIDSRIEALGQIFCQRPPKPVQTAAASGSHIRYSGISTLPYTGDDAVRRQRDSESGGARRKARFSNTSYTDDESVADTPDL